MDIINLYLLQEVNDGNEMAFRSQKDEARKAAGGTGVIAPFMDLAGA